LEIEVDLESIYIPSEDVVAREIEEELIIVPIVAGISDMEDELFTLNETGKAIWKRLDGKKTLKDIGVELAREFNSSEAEIETDIIGFVEELLKRRMLVKT